MVATMIDRMGLDPSFLIGGIVEGYGTNGRDGSGDVFVAEADESDGSFLFLDPDVVVVTNVEADHLDHYGTLENIEKTFCKFMSSVGEDGSVIVCGDNPHLPELARSTGRRVLTYGFSDGCDYVCAPDDTHHKLESHLTVHAPGDRVEKVTIHSNPGRHNMLNATAALAVADVLGLDVHAAAEALSSFEGVRRRFTHVGDIDGVTVVDDYGHHPTEVAATLSAAKDLGFDRVVVCFQPHRYSRTQTLAPLFAHAFDDADVLLVMDVFSAGEMPIPGISGKTVAGEVSSAGVVPSVSYVPNRHDLIDGLVSLCKPGDLLITMGAGDVTSVGPDFIRARQEAMEDGSSAEGDDALAQD
jgi:UDP-N-acetylmuramate--alanine ligase